MSTSVVRGADYALSGSDIEAFIPKSLVLTYSELCGLPSLESVLKKHSCLVILFESSEGFGHWTILFPAVYSGVEGELEFFDSYASYPDDNLSLIDEEFRYESGQDYPCLTELLLRDKRSAYMHVNEFGLQGRRTMTCGRWCILRYYFRDISPKEFCSLIDRLSELSGLSYDDLAVVLTGS